MTRFSSGGRAAAAACAAAGALALVYGIGVLTEPGQWVDDEVFGLVQRVGIGPLGEWLPTVGRWFLSRVMVVVLAAVGVVALVRGRWADLVASAAVVLVAVPLSWWLRTELPRPDLGYSYVENTLPSTHVTLVAAAAVGVAWLWPSGRTGQPVGLLVGVVGLSCLGNVVGYAHRPSDVVASVLLVVAVASTVSAVRLWCSAAAPAMRIR